MEVAWGPASGREGGQLPREVFGSSCAYTPLRTARWTPSVPRKHTRAPHRQRACARGGRSALLPSPPPVVSNSSTSCLFLASIPRAWLTRKAALLFGVFLDEYFMLGRLCRGQLLLALSRLISEEASAEHGARLLVQTAGPGPPAALPLSEGLSAAMTSDLGGRNTPRISLSTAQKGPVQRQGGHLQGLRSVLERPVGDFF